MKRPKARIVSDVLDRVRGFEVRGLGALGRGRNVPYLLLGVALILFPILDSDSSHVNVAADAGHWILLALGLNIVVGYAGLLDLGYAAFFAIGSYAFAILASGQFNIHVSFWILLPLSALVAALFGVLLGAPTLKLRGDYLAIVTLGFGEIIRIFLNNLNAPLNITNGPQGVNLIDPFRIGGFSFARPEVVLGVAFSGPQKYYYLLLLITIGVVV